MLSNADSIYKLLILMRKCRDGDLFNPDVFNIVLP